MHCTLCKTRRPATSRFPGALLYFATMTSNPPPNLPRPPPPAPAGERASQPGFETAAPHSQTQKTLRQSRKRNRKTIRKERGLTSQTATMCLQPLQLAVVSLQLPLQLLDRGLHPDCTLRRPFSAPTPTVRTDVPASPASHVETHKSYTCAGFTAALSRPARLPRRARNLQLYSIRLSRLRRLF